MKKTKSIYLIPKHCPICNRDYTGDSETSEDGRMICMECKVQEKFDMIANMLADKEEHDG